MKVMPHTEYINYLDFSADGTYCFIYFKDGRYVNALHTEDDVWKVIYQGWVFDFNHINDLVYHLEKREHDFHQAIPWEEEWGEGFCIYRKSDVSSSKARKLRRFEGIDDVDLSTEFGPLT